MKWISVNEKLPPEPVRQVNTLDKIMAAIEAEEPYIIPEMENFSMR